MEIQLEGEPIIAAILADRVHNVTDIEMDQVENAPNVGMHWKPEYVQGIGKWEDKFIIIPNLEQIFTNGNNDRIPGTEGKTVQ